jgi:hypothetical protein
MRSITGPEIDRHVAAVQTAPDPDKVAALVDLINAGNVMADALRGSYIVPGSAKRWGDALAAWEGRGNE